MQLHSVQIGHIAPLGPDGVPSGYVKQGVTTAVQIGPVGAIGDEQADLTVHGGPEKAVYGYGIGHYATWQAEYPEHVAKLVPGGFGENLTIDGLSEEDICIGDVHRIGTATLQICQPRQPCFKFALYFGDNRLPKAMVRTGRSGWYYRVIEPGMLRAGDSLTLVDRPQPTFPFSRLVSIVNRGSATPDEIEALAAMPELASALRSAAAASLSKDRPR